jgi:hypothetical protein
VVSSIFPPFSSVNEGNDLNTFSNGRSQNSIYLANLLRPQLRIERFRSMGLLQAFRFFALFSFAGQLADNVSNDEAQDQY